MHLVGRKYEDLSVLQQMHEQGGWLLHTGGQLAPSCQHSNAPVLFRASGLSAQKERAASDYTLRERDRADYRRERKGNLGCKHGPGCWNGKDGQRSSFQPLDLR